MNRGVDGNRPPTAWDSQLPCALSSPRLPSFLSALGPTVWVQSPCPCPACLQYPRKRCQVQVSNGVYTEYPSQPTVPANTDLCPPP